MTTSRLKADVGRVHSLSVMKRGSRCPIKQWRDLRNVEGAEQWLF